VEHFFFWLGLAFILTHEMDAIRLHEWRMFPLTFFLPDQTGYLVFTGVHVPLYFVLFYYLFPTGNTTLNESLVRGLDVFFMVHVFLHIAFLWHPKNEFKSAFSWIIIIGAGLGGFVDLFYTYWK
jgi:hypothetical protein